MSATLIALKLLLSDDTVSDLVSDRIYPVTAPQGASLPYIVVSMAFEDQDIHLDGARDGFDSRISVACHADSVAAADALGEAVKARMGYVINEAILNDESPAEEIARATSWKEGTDLLDYNDARTIFRRLMDFNLRWTK